MHVHATMAALADGSATDNALVEHAPKPAGQPKAAAKPKPAGQPKAAAKPKARRKRAPKFVWRKRDAQDSRYYNLQLDINDVKQKIQELTQYRAMLSARGLAARQDQPGACVRTVHEYMRVFRHGLRPAPREVDVPAFLGAIMAPDVWINEFRGGVELILSQWAVYGACFAHIDLRCVDVVVLPIQDASGREGFVVRAMGDYTAHITANTMAIMFPHTLQFPWLTSQLVGRDLAGRSHYDFVFDGLDNRILRCDVSIDFVGAFAKLLPDPRDLSVVFNGAKVESDFYLGDGDDKPAEGPLVDAKPFKDVPPSSPPHAALRANATRDVESPERSKMDLSHILS